MIQIKENEIIEFKATYQEGLFDTEAKECTYTIACMDVFKNKELLEKYKIDCIITDPPYNLLDHKIETGIDTDKMFSLFYEYLPKNSFCSFFGQHPGLNDFLNSAYKAGFKYKAEIIWDKMGISNPFGDVLRSHENNIVLTKGSQRVYNNEVSFEDWVDENYFLKTESLKKQLSYWKAKAQGREVTGMSNSKAKSDHQTYRHLSRITQTLGNDTKRIQSVWHVQRDQMSKKGQKSHVTQKPLEFMSRLVKMLSKEGQLVCDPFGGSGSTLLSCLKIRRDCIMYEIHEDIANFAIHRLLTYFDDFDIKYSYKKY